MRGDFLEPCEVSVLMRADTLEALGDHLAQRLAGPALESHSPEDDATLVADLTWQAAESPGTREVLLTGVTGFVGPWLLRALLAGYMHEILQPDAFIGFAVALYAAEISLSAAAIEQVFARLVSVVFFLMGE